MGPQGPQKCILGHTRFSWKAPKAQICIPPFLSLKTFEETAMMTGEE